VVSKERVLLLFYTRWINNYQKKYKFKLFVLSALLLLLLMLLLLLYTTTIIEIGTYMYGLSSYDMTYDNLWTNRDFVCVNRATFLTVCRNRRQFTATYCAGD